MIQHMQVQVQPWKSDASNARIRVRPGSRAGPSTSLSITGRLTEAQFGVPRVGMDSGVEATQISTAFLSHHHGPSSPTSASSLNHVHLSEALLKSEDNGATLDFSHMRLTDVGEYGAEELATIGREDSMEDESSVLRCESPLSACRNISQISLPLSDCQDHLGLQPPRDPTHGICATISPSLPQLEE
jgi:hypothetical protein